jgi:glutamate 5-kinase
VLSHAAGSLVNRRDTEMRVVIKVGTSTLAYKTGRINLRNVDKMCKVISDIKNAGYEVIFVTSGAIAMGAGKLNLTEYPSDIPSRQACAAVGQCELMYTYDKHFSEYHHHVAQMLLTGDDLQNKERYNNIANLLLKLLELNILPIINENDTVSTDEIAVGDNDTLSASVAKSIDADLLVILSDIDGLYTDDPHKNPDAKLIPEVREIDEKIADYAGGKGSPFSSGGMATKLAAAKICMESGIDMIIVNNSDMNNLYKAVEGEPVGTRFIGKK